MRLSIVPSVKESSCLLVFVPQQGLPKQKIPADLYQLSTKLLKDKTFKAKKKSSLFLPLTSVRKSKSVLLVGLGDDKKSDLELFRQAAGQALREMEKHSIPSLEVDLSLLNKTVSSTVSFEKGKGQGVADEVLSTSKVSKTHENANKTIDTPSLVRALAEGFVLSHYQFDELKTKDKEKTPIKDIFFTGVKADLQLKKALEEGQILAESVNFARLLGDTPANLMTPSILAESVRKKGLGLKGLKVSIWNKDRIKKEKMGGVLGVSQGSAQDPRVILMEYKGLSGDNKKSQKPLCFVGKGLTFDSGGISIKPAKNMDEMKFDMCGSTAVIGTMLAIARLKLKVNVLGLVGSAENMPGANAVKPGDVLRARNGKTMEVLNTDAEGRLVLADMLSYACEQKPEFIVDAATLTGAVVVSLSNIYTGLFTRNENLAQKIKNAGLCAGEKIWPLPLDDFHVQDVQSKVADVANISSVSGGGSSTAAAFLEHFVEKSIPWAHVDIAGTAWNVDNRLPYCRPKSASGVMVRTFVQICRSHSLRGKN